MGEAARLADHITRTLTGPMWHGPALLEVLHGVSAEQAAHPPGPAAHSIWELVLHVAVWAEIARERMRGASPGSPRPADDFPAPGAVTDERWSAAIARLDASYRSLSAATAELSDDDLRQVVRNTDPRHSVRAMLHGVIEHGTYHGGQMALIKRMSRTHSDA